MKKKRILVIAPHADDEVLGLGGYLLHESTKGSEIYLVIGTVGGEDKRQNYEVRKAELTQVSKYLKVKQTHILFAKCDSLLDTIPSVKIISAIDLLIDVIKPNEIFLNYKSQHQDHIKIYDCCMASLRLREGYSPDLVALYEYPFIGSNIDFINAGKWYHDITDVIKEKVALFEAYETQLRNKPSPLNGGGICNLARMRGLESGYSYAELFYIIRIYK